MLKKNIISYGVLNFFCIITLFVINLYFLILLKQKIYVEQNIYCSPSDFTLFLSNLNNSLDYYDDYCISKKKIINNKKEKFKDFVSFLKNKVIYTKKKSESIYDINFCYKLKDFMKSAKKVQKINYKLLQIVNNSKQKKLNIKYALYGEKRKFFEIFCGCVCKKGLSIKKLLKNREINQTKIDFLLKNSKTLTKNNFAGSIFLTFNTIKQKEEYYSLYPHYFLDKMISFFRESKYYFCWCWVDENSKKKFLRRKNIKLYTAPEPEDIIWENIEYDIWFRIKRCLIIYSITFFLLLISFLIVLGLTYLKEYLINHQISSRFIVKYGISFLITLTISGLNEIFYFLLEILTKKEKQISMTNYYLSFSLKLTFFTFISSAIVPLASNLIDKGYGNNEYLVDNMVLIFLSNSFFTPILWVFDIKYIYKKIKICLIERKKNPDEKHCMTQRELNNLYQLPDMKISYKYSYIAKTLLLSLFYLTIFPFGIIISLIGFILAYYLELFNFTHLYKRPEMINEKICLFYIEYFVINLFIFCLGIFIFMKSIFASDIWVIINMVIFGILSIIPYTKFIKCKCFNLSNPFINNTNYEDVYFSFYNDYQRQNPITKIDGLKNYINKLRINGFISQKVYNFSFMNIDTINVMELYYRSKMNRNIVQSQQALAAYNNTFRKSLQNKKALKNKIEKKEILNRLSPNTNLINNRSSIYDEQLTNLLKQSLYKQRFGNNLDYLNKILNNNYLFNSNNKETILNKIQNRNEQKNEDELKSEEIIDKNKDYILNQYKYPFLLNISHNITTTGDLGVINNNQISNGLNNMPNQLNGIKEVPELNENENGNGNDSEKNEIIKDKNYYGVDYDIYSRKSNSSSSSGKKDTENNKINIEMKDLSKDSNSFKNKYNYEMSNLSEENEEINKKEENNNNKDRNSELKKYFLNLTKDFYDGDNDSDYDD